MMRKVEKSLHYKSKSVHLLPLSKKKISFENRAYSSAG